MGAISRIRSRLGARCLVAAARVDQLLATIVVLTFRPEARPGCAARAAATLAARHRAIDLPSGIRRGWVVRRTRMAVDRRMHDGRNSYDEAGPRSGSLDSARCPQRRGAGGCGGAEPGCHAG